MGNRGCTMTSDSAASSTKLEKILEFFDNTGRMVPISVTGELMAPTKLPSVEARPTPVRDLELDHKLKERTTSSLSGQNQFKTTKHVRKGSEGATEAFLRFKENFGLQSKASSNAPKTMPEKAVEEPPNLRRQHSRPPHDSIPTAPRAYMDAFARFNARREGKLEIPNPDPNAIFTQNTRQRLSTINDSSMFRNNCHPVSQESSRHNGDTVALQLKPTNPRDESFARMKRNRDAPKNPTAGEKKTPTAESSVVSPALGTDQTNTSISTTALVSNVGDENKKPRNVSNGFSLQAQDSESGIKDGEVLPIVARQGLDTSISSLNAKLEASTLLPTGTQPESPALETHLSPQSPTEQAQTFAPQQEMDFPTRYRQKYQAMKSTFDSFRGGDQSSPNEDQLFRRLGEAFVMEDGKAFEEVYTLLLGELQGCLVGPAAGFQ